MLITSEPISPIYDHEEEYLLVQRISKQTSLDLYKRPPLAALVLYVVGVNLKNIQKLDAGDNKW